MVVTFKADEPGKMVGSHGRTDMVTEVSSPRREGLISGFTVSRWFLG